MWSQFSSYFRYDDKPKDSCMNYKNGTCRKKCKFHILFCLTDTSQDQPRDICGGHYTILQEIEVIPSGSLQHGH